MCACTHKHTHIFQTTTELYNTVINLNFQVSGYIHCTGHIPHYPNHILSSTPSDFTPLPTIHLFHCYQMQSLNGLLRHTTRLCFSSKSIKNIFKKEGGGERGVSLLSNSPVLTTQHKPQN